ncbi:OmpA family protein [Sulfurisoma sediminicola]|jgi:OOP family OmpA-OmpF porin|uniref:Beta-barrel assembly machine subunit RmpM n=1 Tax=Sulfurisoma sediminicola TaxID=1381557 RepID=A0A497XK79_9PROT|nr:OmpA family protein [Sulfurisoma sediminicola]RLJ67676.1 Beta-barrel assembly machine subunit RmpM [Sulfurisoma sediminicola]
MQKKPVTTSLIVLALAGAAIGTAVAQQNTGYVIDTRGAVVKSGFGECWRTGYWTPAMAIAECDPGLVKSAPAAAAAPAVETMVVHGDGLFDFDKATIKPEGKARLDEAVARLKDKKLDKIVITGHTDRLGSAKYNEKLSQKRADAVKDYLVAKGVDKAKISAVGKGSTMPRTKADECKGKKTKKVVACLAPDRRVEIEATFSK